MGVQGRWINLVDQHRRNSARNAAQDAVFVPACLVIGSVLFNSTLAAVNSHLAPLTPSVVIGTEILFVVAAHAVALINYSRMMTPWYVFLLFITIGALFRSVALGAFDMKGFRDVLLIPTFVVLGMTFDKSRLIRVIVMLQLIILAFLLLEALDTASFAALFNVEDYWINTRGWSADDFWNPESGLFISATRPDERFFKFVDLHRLSSIFLEPVSLGNYCVIIVAFVCAIYNRLSWSTRGFFILSTIVLLAGSDGRLAAVCCAAIIALTLFVHRLPRYSAFIYLPAVTITAFILVGYGGLRSGADDFPGRIAYTAELLGSWDIREWLAISSKPVEASMDSGLAYLILSQSLLGVVVIWAFIVFVSLEDTVAKVRFTHALALYISLTLMVSYSLFTIKTASLLWFIHGSLQRPRSSG